MSSSSDCFICKKSLSERDTVNVTRGLNNLISVSKKRKDGAHLLLEKVKEIEVHTECRREYIKERNIERDSKKASEGKPCTSLRSSTTFNFNKICFICNEMCDAQIETKKPIEKRREVYEVRSLTLKDSLLTKAQLRDAEWGRQVAARINSVIDLVAADACYHKDCYAKFATKLSGNRRRGRPQGAKFDAAFQEFCTFIQTSEECQFSLSDLMHKIEQNLPNTESMTIKTLQNKLVERYGDGVLFATTKKKPTIVCFRGSGLKLINKWYNDRADNEKEEGLRIVEAAASIVREDIRMTVYNTAEYPNITNFTENVESMVPETLQTFVNKVILENKKGGVEIMKKKSVAISHSIIAATRPRSFLSPLQLGLATY